MTGKASTDTTTEPNSTSRRPSNESHRISSDDSETAAHSERPNYDEPSPPEIENSSTSPSDTVSIVDCSPSTEIDSSPAL